MNTTERMEMIKGDVTMAVQSVGMGVKCLGVYHNSESNDYQVIVMATNPGAAKLAAVTAHMCIHHILRPKCWMKLHALDEVRVTSVGEDHFACVILNEDGTVRWFI